MKYRILIFAGILLMITSLGTTQGAQTNLEMQVMDYEPVPLQAGEYADIWVRVTNTGSNTASDVTVEAVDEFPFHTDNRKDTWEIGELDTGDTYTLRAQFRVNENAVYGNNTFKFRKNSGNSDVWITQSFHREVRVDDRSLVVSSLEFPERIAPGSSSQMELELENLANSNFRNIDVRLDTSELPISTRETSRKRISSIGHGETGTASFTIDVDDDADIELYDLPIEFEYQDQAGNQLSMQEITGVNVGGFPNIDVEIEDSDIRSPGRGEVTFRIVNKGDGQARFTQVELLESDQYEILSENSVYIGSMIDDDFQTASFDLYVEEDQTVELPVEVSYTDGTGEQTENFEIERDLYTSSQLRRYGLESSSIPWILIVVLVAFFAGGVYYWRYRRE